MNFRCMESNGCFGLSAFPETNTYSVSSSARAAIFRQSRLRQCFFAVLFVLFLHTTNGVAQENWPEYRGPSGDGHAPTIELHAELTDEMIVWRTPIHGKGWSSPVVWNQQVWLTTATPDGAKMSVICVSLNSGEVVYDKVLYENESPDFCHDMNSYASPTPAVEQDRVYVHFGKYGTACLDSKTADLVWERRDLPCNHHRGPASSPILYKDLLIVAFDGFDVQYVIALNKQTGETVWKVDRDIDYGTDNGDLKKAYCTGSIVEVNGEPLLVYPSAVATIAYRPMTGEVVWTAYHDGMNASARPVVTNDGVVIITNGMGKMVGVSADGKGNVTETHVKWMTSASVAKKTSQLLVDGLLYMVSDKAVVSCVDPATGETLNRKRLDGSFAASPIYANKKLFFFNREGQVFTIRPGRDLELLAESRIGDGYMASPAAAGNRLVLRSLSELICLEAK